MPALSCGAADRRASWERTPPADVADELAALVSQVREQGESSPRGETVFRNKHQACLRCHAFAGVGGQVGPDLSSIGASAQIDYLIESILVPNKAVKENYHSVVVSTHDGRILGGVKLRENDREVVVRTAEDQELVIPKSTIDEMELGGSIMPAGLADTLTRQELVDLSRFLAELGKVGPYAAVEPERQGRARRRGAGRRMPQARSECLAQNGLPSTADDNAAWTWGEAYSAVSGVLPLEGLLTPLKTRKDEAPATDRGPHPVRDHHRRTAVDGCSTDLAGAHVALARWKTARGPPGDGYLDSTAAVHIR